MVVGQVHCEVYLLRFVASHLLRLVRLVLIVYGWKLDGLGTCPVLSQELLELIILSLQGIHFFFCDLKLIFYHLLLLKHCLNMPRNDFLKAVEIWLWRLCFLGDRVQLLQRGHTRQRRRSYCGRHYLNKLYISES